ncbi:MAG: diaminopimelate epimerase [Brevinema sp.]
MKIPFIKMTGLGNDYIYFNLLQTPDLSDLIIKNAVKLSDRNFGIGGDGVILILPSNQAYCRMQMFSDSGLEGEMCGNGIRGLAKIVWDRQLIAENPLTVETLAGIRSIEITSDQNNLMTLATVNMGALYLDPTTVPFCPPQIQTQNDISFFIYHHDNLELKFFVGCIGKGSRHAVCFAEQDVDTIDFCTIGKSIELNEDLFPDRVNVEFVNILSSNTLKMRVWERGSGHTLACGTGATFAAAIASKLGFVSSPSIEVQLERGSLFISEQNLEYLMQGPSEYIFEGVVDLL